jgi:hypothetical protein
VPTAVLMSDFDLPTRSASGFLLRYIAPKVEPVQLYSFLARRLPFQLSAPQSDIIIGSGHGSKTSFTGQNESVILEVGKYNPREVKGKVIKLLSCQTGISLGPDLIKNGAAAFLGYKDDYVWVMDADLASTPWADNLAGACLLPVVDGLSILLDGKTAEESLEIELAGYTRNAAAAKDELIKSCLDFNHDNAVLLGDPGARVRRRPNITIPLPPPPIFLPIS